MHILGCVHTKILEHLEKIQYFRVIADLGSFSKASLRLGLSQPALTRSVQQLESVLDMQLLKRIPRGVVCTEQGTQLLTLAMQILAVVEAWGPTAPTPTLVRIGTYDTIAASILPGLLKALEKQMPELPLVKISTQRSNSDLMVQLLEGKVDYLLLAEPRLQSGIEAREVARESYAFYVSSAQWKKRRKRAPVLARSEVAQWRILTIPSAIAGMARTVDRLLWDLPPVRLVAFDSFEVAKAATCEGLGVGLLPTLCARREISLGNLIEVSVQGVGHSRLGPHSFFLCHRPQADSGLTKILARLIAAQMSTP